jgi:hypothetical protein
MTRRQRLALRWALVGTLVVLMGACGRTTAQSFHGTVDIGQDDAGRTFQVRIGQLIVLTLGPVTSRSLSWKLLDYPRALLSLTSSDRGSGRFEFRAEMTGIGEVKAALIAACGPPLPAAMAGSEQCPVGAEPGVSVTLRRFTVTVRVT